MDFKKNIYKMYVIRFLAMFHLFSGVTIPFYTLWGKLSYAQLFMLESLFMLSWFALEVPTGAVADYLGRKISIFLGCISIVLAAYIFTIMPNLYLFAIAEIFWGLGKALISGADEALIFDTLKQYKKSKLAKSIFGTLTSMGSLGLVIAAPLGSWIAANIGLEWSIRLFAIPMFIAAVISLSFDEPKIKKKRKSKKYLDIIKKSFKFFSSNLPILALTLDQVFVSGLTFLIYWLYQPKLMDLGISLVFLGFVPSAMNLLVILFLNSLNKIEKIVSDRNLLVLTGLIPGICFIVAGIFGNLYLVLLSFAFIWISRSIRKPVFSHYQNQYIPSSERATLGSLISMWMTLITAIIYPIIGFFIDTLSLNGVLVMIGITAIVFTFASRIEEKMLVCPVD